MNGKKEKAAPGGSGWKQPKKELRGIIIDLSGSEAKHDTPLKAEANNWPKR